MIDRLADLLLIPNQMVEGLTLSKLTPGQISVQTVTHAALILSALLSDTHPKRAARSSSWQIHITCLGVGSSFVNQEDSK